MAVREAIDRWLSFAKENGDVRVTGQRSFDSQLELIQILRAEEVSLFRFARNQKISFAEKLAELTEWPVPREGNEHRVFLPPANESARVIKVTLPGKYGRWEHTPFLYLDRLALMNELVPVGDIQFEDCIEADGGYSIISSMTFFTGPAPSGKEVEKFLSKLGFELYSDESTTLDYINNEAQLILRDCHPGNWVKSKDGILVPIDIVPERIGSE